MSFSLPQFNLTCQVYTGGVFTSSPRLSPVCNLAWGRRVNVASTGGTATPGIPIVCMTLLLPPGTDVRSSLCPSGADGIVVPAGSGRRYAVQVVDDIGKGFANEHRACVLFAVGPWPQPIP